MALTDPGYQRSSAPGQRVDLGGLTAQALAALVGELGGSHRQALLVMKALHDARPREIGAIEGLSRRLLEDLASVGCVRPLAVESVTPSGEGESTRKFLLKTHDGLPVEAVLFGAHQHSERQTLCVSSQVGCKMGCVFCATGHMGFKRNLTAGEIIAQVWEALDRLAPDQRLNNVVFMGMGEPLENFEAVRDACRVLHHERGMRLARRKITLSTVGYVPGLRRMFDERLGVSLALSLHAASNALRSDLVPPNRRYPISEVMELLRSVPRAAMPVLCVEYCLIQGVNDGRGEAEGTARLLAGLPHKVHLIPFNPVEGLPFQAPAAESVLQFARWIEEAGGSVLVRHSRGPDIDAACGQLGVRFMERARLDAARARWTAPGSPAVADCQDEPERRIAPATATADRGAVKTDRLASELVCPNCNATLQGRSCKARCPRCGYFESCSDIV